MKKINYLIFILLIIFCTGFGCENTEVTQTYNSENCMSPLGGWEEKQTGRFINGDQLFENDDNWGLRCRYYEPKAEEFDVSHAEGRSTGDFQFHYEMEIRNFLIEDDKNNYNENTVTEMLNSYCRTGSEVVMPLLLRDGAVNERFQCEWPAEKTGDTWDQINTNALISVTTYKDAIILLGIVKETGQVTFIPPDYSAITETYEAHASNAMQLLYESDEFQIIPDEHEQTLINHALDLLDKIE